MVIRPHIESERTNNIFFKQSIVSNTLLTFTRTISKLEGNRISQLADVHKLKHTNSQYRRYNISDKHKTQFRNDSDNDGYYNRHKRPRRKL